MFVNQRKSDSTIRKSAATFTSIDNVRLVLFDLAGDCDALTQLSEALDAKFPAFSSASKSYCSDAIWLEYEDVVARFSRGSRQQAPNKSAR